MRQRPLNWKKSVVWTRFYYDCIKAINTPASHRLLLWCLQLTSFLTHDLQQTISSNTGIGEFFGCICDTLEKTVSARKRDTTQYSTAKLCQHGSAHASRHGTWKKLQIDRVFTTLSKLRFWCSYSHFLSIFVVVDGDLLWIFCCFVMITILLLPFRSLLSSLLLVWLFLPKVFVACCQVAPVTASSRTLTELSPTWRPARALPRADRPPPATLRNAQVLSLCFFTEVSHRTVRYSHHASSMKSVTERSGTLIMLLHWSQSQNALVFLSCFFIEVSYGTLRYSHYASSLKSVTERSGTLIIQPWCNPLWLTGLKAPTN